MPVRRQAKQTSFSLVRPCVCSSVLCLAFGFGWLCWPTLPLSFTCAPSLEESPRQTDIQTHTKAAVSASRVSARQQSALSEAGSRSLRGPPGARCCCGLWLNLLKVCVSLHLCEWWTWWNSAAATRGARCRGRVRVRVLSWLDWIQLSIIRALEGGSEDLYGGRTSKLEHKGLTH